MQSAIIRCFISGPRPLDASGPRLANPAPLIQHNVLIRRLLLSFSMDFAWVVIRNLLFAGCMFTVPIGQHVWERSYSTGFIRIQTPIRTRNHEGERISSCNGDPYWCWGHGDSAISREVLAPFFYLNPMVRLSSPINKRVHLCFLRWRSSKSDGVLIRCPRSPKLSRVEILVTVKGCIRPLHFRN